MDTASPFTYPGHGNAGGIEGVDMDALRAKYSRPREELAAEQRAKDAANPVRNASGRSEATQAAYDRLSDIVMCQACQALGIVKKHYGYRVIDEECQTCGGEGVLRKGQAKYASDELKQKVKRVEAMVDECDDIDELERLEAALNKRTLAALDAVLPKAAAAEVAEAEEAAKEEAVVEEVPAAEEAKATGKKDVEDEEEEKLPVLV